MLTLAGVAVSAENIKSIAESIGTVAGCLGGGIRYLRKFVPEKFPWPGKRGLETITVDNIETFRKKLCRVKPYEKPQRITAEGTFFRSVLISSGGWERDHEASLPDFKLKTGLQTWLYRGFEEWAPSWDFNPAENDPMPYFLGQIGTRDEANSLPVIIPGEKGKRVREEMGTDVVLQSTLTGLLYHRSNLPAHLSTKLSRYGKAFDYCILLDEEDKEHRISNALGETKRQYSGYLWQCWGPDPKQWLSEMKTPRLDEVYFLWEHTDLTKPDALEYNLDSLYHKAEYLLKKNPGLVLLQKSSSVVEGKPECPSELFYRYILDKENPT